MQELRLILALIVVLLTGWGIYKKYNVNIVLLFAGLSLNLIAICFGVHDILPKGAKSTGFIGFDLFEQLRLIARHQLTSTGLIMLVAGGFATYMDAMGASDKLVTACLKPLQKLSKPYILVGCVFILGNFLGLVVTSAARMAMLLIVSVYPILIGLGVSNETVSNLSRAAAIATALVFSYAPSSVIAVIAANTAGIDPMTYLFKYQLPVAVPAVIATALVHIFVQKYYDSKLTPGKGAVEIDNAELEKKKERAARLPAIYAFLPLTPLVLLFIFNKMVFKTVVLDVATRMVLASFIEPVKGWVIAIVVDWIYRRNTTQVFKDGFAMFRGMGTMMTNVVGLIFVAGLFAAGLQTTGLIGTLIDGAKNVGLGLSGTGILMSIVIAIVTILTGSGVASFTALVPLAPSIAESFGGNPADMALMLQFASECARPLSPVAGVIIICAGFAKSNPIALVKRTFWPCLTAMTVSLSLAVYFMK